MLICRQGKATFASYLPHAFDKVKDQLETGMAEVYRLKQFVMKLCQMQQDFSNELATLVKREKDKIAMWRKPDFMVSCGGAVLDVFEKAEEMARIHSCFATEARLSVVEPLQTFEEIGKPILNRIIDKERSITSGMDARRSLMEKRKAECLRLLSVHAGDLGIDASSLDLNAQRPARSNRGGMLLHKIGTRAAEVLGKADEARVRNAQVVEKACASYSDEIAISNHMLHSYTSREVPELLFEMQSLEEMRINSVRGHLEAFGALFSPMATRYQALSDGLRRSCAAIDLDGDIVGFCTNAASQYADGSRRLDPFQYELAIPLDEILRLTSSVVNASPPPCPVYFKTTLDGIMERQRESSVYPEHTLPNVFTVLKAAVVRAGGLTTEGIFRVSPEASAVVDLARQFESGDLRVPADTSPHVPAALLKKWMRELTSPIMPDQLYEACVDLGRQTACPGRERLQSVIGQMPVHHARLMTAVLHLVQQFAAHEAENRMSVKNLCIVLVPSVLRCPENADPIQVMKNAQFECRFLEYCVEAVDTSSYPVGEEDDAVRFLNSAAVDAVQPSPRASVSSDSPTRKEAVADAKNGPETPAVPPLLPMWRSAFDADGKQYYFHIETRETTWTRPC